jgi:hypothetical protein
VLLHVYTLRYWKIILPIYFMIKTKFGLCPWVSGSEILKPLGFLVFLCSRKIIGEGLNSFRKVSCSWQGKDVLCHSLTPYLVLCIFSIWVLLSCIIYNKPFNLSNTIALVLWIILLNYQTRGGICGYSQHFSWCVSNTGSPKEISLSLECYNLMGLKFNMYGVGQI